MKVRSNLVENRRVAILGMARSGMAAARLLRHYGASVFVSELKSQAAVSAQVESLQKAGIECETGGHTFRALEDVDFVVLSPGIAPTIPIVKEVRRRQLPLFSEIEVTSWLCPATIVAITGSNGKSTTTALMAHILNEAGHKAVATGNIGSPFADDVLTLGEQDYAVVEVSSFQLELIDTFKPQAATILNITPDHLDRYGDYTTYIQSKYRIADEQDESDYLILNADDPHLTNPRLEGSPTRLHFSTKQETAPGVWVKDDHLVFTFSDRSGTICPVAEIGIPGPHNLANSAAAAALSLSLGINTGAIARGLASFGGIPHRLEFVTEVDGVRWVNDSKATNVDSVNYALQSINAPIILIMGGRDKGGDFSTLSQLVAAKVKLLLLIGEAGELIGKALGETTQVLEAGQLVKALELAQGQAKAGDTVLLSPGCASFDQFRDFEERGEIFKQTVKELTGGHR
ncbi:MAG: UDP-N-acetylmuramoyl-L-alanine--D-glutamate ligase [bacterium]